MEKINRIVGTKFPGEAVTNSSANTVDLDEDGKESPQYPIEIWTNFRAESTLLHDKLTFGTGFPVMLLRVTDSLRANIYGVRYIVNTLHPNLFLP